LLAAFQNYGIQPEPLLFQTQGALVWGLIASMYVCNILLLILNLPLIGLWVGFPVAPAVIGLISRSARRIAIPPRACH
jgi:putative tricarboxylic transport membrane protein